MHGRPLIPLALSCLVVAHAPALAIEAEHAPVAKRGASARMPDRPHRVQRGKVSWYGDRFKGHRTASGEHFDPHALTMAHRTLPLGTIVDVTNNANGKRVRLRVNDRGPVPRDRVGDVSLAASRQLGFVDDGVTDATIRVVSMPSGKPELRVSDATAHREAARSG